MFGQRRAATLRTALSAAARPDAKADALVARRLRVELPCAAHDAGGDWLEGVASAARGVGALREERPCFWAAGTGRRYGELAHGTGVVGSVSGGETISRKLIH